MTFSFFIIFKHRNRWNTGATTIFYCSPTLDLYSSLPGIYLISMDPIVLSVVEKDPESNKESLIDRDADVFDPDITISPISMSRSNLDDIKGNNIPFLEVVQASIVPYVVEFSFPFPEFIGWCAEKYFHTKRVIVNKHGYQVLCRIDTLSVRESLNIPEAFFVNSESFNEEKMIRVYRKCQPELKSQLIQ